MPEIIVKLGDKVVQRYFFDKDVLSIGRARDNDIVIENLSVSRNHARIRRSDGKYILTDLNSANGTLVNNVRVTKTEIVDGDLVQLGKHVLQFVENAAPPQAAAAGPSAPTQADAPSGPAPVPASAALSPAGASSSEIGQPAVLIVMKGKQADQRFKVARTEISIGRANENDVRLHDWFVSKKHAMIVRRENGTFVLRDLQSWRGTTVNGVGVKGEVSLKTNDEITMGTTVLKFLERAPAEMTFDESPSDPPHVPGEDDSPSQVSQPSKPTQDDVVRLAPDEATGASSGSGRSATQIPMQVAPPAPPPPPPRPAAINAPAKVSAGGDDDEFSPMSEDELEMLENEALSSVSSDQIDALARADWENFEMDRMASMGEAIDQKSLLEDEKDMTKAEEAFARPHVDTMSDLEDSKGGLSAKEVAAEEEALFGGEMEKPGSAPMKDDSSRLKVPAKTTAPAAAPAPAAAKPARPTAPPPPRVPAGASASQVSNITPVPDRELSPEEREKEIAIWQKAMKNKSALIRKNAAKQLKKLTGKDYDWESPPNGA